MRVSHASWIQLRPLSPILGFLNDYETVAENQLRLGARPVVVRALGWGRIGFLKNPDGPGFTLRGTLCCASPGNEVCNLVQIRTRNIRYERSLLFGGELLSATRIQTLRRCYMASQVPASRQVS